MNSASHDNAKCILAAKEVSMTMHKEDVLEIVHQLPDEVDIEELIYRLYLISIPSPSRAPDMPSSRPCA